MTEPAIQDRYAAEYAHCYGCGRLNEDGLKLKSYEDGEETVCHFTPEARHSGGYPGFLYGGMIASLMDCHGAATAWAAKARTEPQTATRFVTASLQIDFRAPAPTNVEVEVRGKVREIRRRKVVVDLTLSAGGKLCAEGSAVMVQIPLNRQES